MTREPRTEKRPELGTWAADIRYDSDAAQMLVDRRDLLREIASEDPELIDV